MIAFLKFLGVIKTELVLFCYTHFTFSNPMLEPLKERTKDTCEENVRGGPVSGGVSLVTQAKLGASPPATKQYARSC